MKLEGLPRPPLPCVILSIDSGKQSGWAIRKRGKLVDSGTAVTWKDRSRVVSLAQEHESKLSPLIVVFEDWSPGGWKSHKTMFGMGVPKGRWLEWLDVANHPGSRVTKVQVGEWRRWILGKRYTNAKREQIKPVAIAHVKSVESKVVMSDNEAEAICIGLWAERAQEIYELLPKKIKTTHTFWMPKVYESGG